VATARAKLTVGAVLWIVGAVGYLVLEATAAAPVMPPYSYLQNYISALGVPAWSPRAVLMNTAFCLEGTMLFTGAVLIARARTGLHAGLFVCLAAANAVGNYLVGIVHGGSALASGGHSWLHPAGALLALACGNAAILIGSGVVADAIARPWYRAVSVVIAGLGLLSLVMFAVAARTGAMIVLPKGAWERGSVYSILLWQLVTSVLLLTRSRARNG
jgi:hypothetical protein